MITRGCALLAVLAAHEASALQAARPLARRAAALRSSSSAIIIDNIQTDASRLAKKKEKEEAEEALADARMSPAQEESELVLKITGEPKVGVSGLFGAARSDQLVLDVLLSQETWGSLVALAPDVGAAKKRLMSRSARYSGLLNKLQFAEWNVVAPDAASLAQKLDAEKIEAWLCFDVKPGDVSLYLEAARLAHSVKRVVVGCNGPVAEGATAKVSPDLEWSVVACPGGYSDEGAAGEALSVDFVEDANSGPVSREDAMLVAAEAFVLKGAQKKALSVAYGGVNATAYLKSLREAGYSRRCEIAKLVEGSLKEWVATVDSKTEAIKKKASKKKTSIYDEDTPIEIIRDSSPEFAAQLAANRAASKKIRDEQIAKAATVQLKSEYGEKQFTTCRAVTEEEYIRYYWKRALDQQAQYLGYKKTEDHYESGGPTVAFPDFDDDDDDDDDDGDEDDGEVAKTDGDEATK